MRFFGDVLTGGALRKRTEELYDAATVRIERTAETRRSSGEILSRAISRSDDEGVR
jgi:hypothetical protein